jgi:transcriptional regulator with XRE-family HTH domain
MTQSEKEQFYISIGDAIRDARINIGMSQASLADKIKMSRASIVNIEKGRQNPPIHLLWQFSKLLKVSITDLLPKFTLVKNDDVDFFEEKLRDNIDKGIIDENSEKSLQSFLRRK